LLTCLPVFAATPAPLVCASGAPVGTIDLRVVSPSPRVAKEPLPLRTVARLEEGDTIIYKPVLRPREERKGEVSMVLIPADTKPSGPGRILVFDARPAAKQQEWMVPWRTSIAAFVYGPSGLNVKKVQAFLDKDDQLIGELADYADKTAKAEALIAALTATDRSNASIEAALQGFSGGGAAGTLVKGAPLDQQTMVMLQTVNPQVAAYDPLSPTPAQPVGQAARLAASVGQMFLGNPLGIAAGGTAFLLNLSAVAFPKSEFRSMFSQPMPEDALGLCAKAGVPAPHTRLAYLWAVRIPNAAPPKLAVGKANSLPADVKSPLPLTGSDFAFLDHARDWNITPDRGKAVPVKVQVLAESKSIELAIPKNVKPGRYSLAARWDWDQFEVGGFFEVRPLDGFGSARLSPSSQDSLVADTGKLPLTLEGADFEFVTKVEIKKLDDAFATAAAVPFVLPHGVREGVQDHITIQADTSALQPGPYHLILSQVDGKAHEIRVMVLPPLPVIDNLPAEVNQGIRTLSLQLKGKRLDLLDKIQPSKGTAILGAGSPDGTWRKVIFKIPDGLAAGSAISLTASIANRVEPVTIPDALRILPPKPSIAQMSISQVPQQQVSMEPGELPAGVRFTAMLRVANLPPSPGVELQCEGSSTGSVTLAPQQQAGGTRLDQLTPDQLFLTLDTGTWMNGCMLDAVVKGSTGESEPRRIGRIVEVPAIEQLKVDAADTGPAAATLTGRNLESIEKAGWNPQDGSPVLELPEPIGPDGRDQKLEFRISRPATPDATLYVWLRGDSKARPTTLHPN
jgi:hypothetical protein